MSSARHPHVVHTRLQPAKYFQLNTRANSSAKNEQNCELTSNLVVFLVRTQLPVILNCRQYSLLFRGFVGLFRSLVLSTTNFGNLSAELFSVCTVCPSVCCGLRSPCCKVHKTRYFFLLLLTSHFHICMCFITHLHLKVNFKYMQVYMEVVV